MSTPKDTCKIALAFGAGAAIAVLLLKRQAQAKVSSGYLEKDADAPPTLVRRSTLLVSDIENSLKIYRDALGLEVIYDKEVPIGGKGLPTGVFDAKGRLIFLRSAKDHTVGVIALMQYLDKPIAKPASIRRQLTTGDCVLVLNTNKVGERMGDVKKVPGVHVQSEGTVDIYPGMGTSKVKVLGNSFFDPDGHFVELNEVCQVE